jgi:hypothetical protein
LSERITGNRRGNNKRKGEMNVDKDNHYVAADLASNLVSEIKTFEDELSERTNKKVVVIAYEKDENDLNP